MGRPPRRLELVMSCSLCQTLEKQEAPSQDQQKELRARIDAATCSASLKPKLRASLESIAKRLAAKEKAKGAAAAGAAAEVVVEQCDAAAAAGHTSVVVEVPAGVDGKAVGKLAKKNPQGAPGPGALRGRGRRREGGGFRGRAR